MAKLPKYTLSKDKGRGDWRLTNDKSDQVIKRFDTKADAAKGGVKIKKLDGRIQEERTYPGSKDPPESKGYAGVVSRGAIIAR